MAKFNCHCGAIIQTSGLIPNPLEWKMLSDEAFDEFSGDVPAELIYRAALSAFECANCRRLWVYWDGFENEPTCYHKEGKQDPERHQGSRDRPD